MYPLPARVADIFYSKIEIKINIFACIIVIYIVHLDINLKIRNMKMNQIADIVRNARLMNQRTLSDVSQSCGVSVPVVRAIEAGSERVLLSNLIKVLNELNLKLWVK